MSKQTNEQQWCSVSNGKWTSFITIKFCLNFIQNSQTKQTAWSAYKCTQTQMTFHFTQAQIRIFVCNIFQYTCELHSLNTRSKSRIADRLISIWYDCLSLRKSIQFFLFATKNFFECHNFWLLLACRVNLNKGNNNGNECENGNHHELSEIFVLKVRASGVVKWWICVFFYFFSNAFVQISIQRSFGPKTT